MPDNSDIVFVPGSCLTLNSARRMDSNSQNESYVVECEVLFESVNINIILADVAGINPTQHPTGSLEAPPLSQEHVTGEHQQRDDATDPALRNIPSVAAIFVAC